MPVVHRHDHERRAAAGLGLVARAADRARDVLRARRLGDPHRVVPREAGEAPGGERLEREMPPVLLADDDYKWRAVQPRGRQRADRIAEAGERVQDDERRLAPADRPARREADDGPLVQGQHEADVVGQADEERHLGRAGIAEEGREAAAAEDVERRLADRPLRHASAPAPSLPAARA